VEREGGFKPNVFLMADYGFNTYSTTVETMQATIDEHPDWVQCFVDGSTIGWVNFLYGDNSAALALIKQHNPEMTDEQLAFTIDALKEYGIVDSGDAETLGIGAMTDERHKSFYDKMVAAGVVQPDLDYTQIYTKEFVCKGVGKELAGQ
jgi:NitT/TauT family transport system substrate-binding protein